MKFTTATIAAAFFSALAAVAIPTTTAADMVPSAARLRGSTAVDDTVSTAAVMDHHGLERRLSSTSCGKDFCDDPFPVTATGNKFRLKSQSVEGKCLDWDVKTNNVMMWGCHDGDNQAWTYDEITKAIKSVRDPSKCVDLSGRDFRNFQVYSCHNNENQQIRYTKKGDEYGLLWATIEGTKKCFDVHIGDSYNIYGEEDCDYGSEQQEFYIDERNGEYYQNSNFALVDSCLAYNPRMKYGCWDEDGSLGFQQKGEIARQGKATVEKYYCPEDRPIKAALLEVIYFGDKAWTNVASKNFKWELNFGCAWRSF